jgi:hypothetical protein
MSSWSDDARLSPAPGGASDVAPLRVRRHGLSFQLVVEPDGTGWVEVARRDGPLIAFEEVSSDETDLEAFADRWIAERLDELNPVHRCAECGLPVEVIDPREVRRLRRNHAVEYDLWAEFADDRSDDIDLDPDHKTIRFSLLTLCVTCRRDLVRRHRWLRELLSPPHRGNRVR